MQPFAKATLTKTDSFLYQNPFCNTKTLRRAEQGPVSPSNVTQFPPQIGKLHLQGAAEAGRGACRFIAPINILLTPCELNKQKHCSGSVPFAEAGSRSAIAGFAAGEAPRCCRSLAGPFWTEYRKVQQWLFDTT